MLHLPFLDRLRRHTLLSKLHSGDIVRRVYNEKQYKGNNVDPYQDRNGVQEAADNVIDHATRLSVLRL